MSDPKTPTLAEDVALLKFVIDHAVHCQHMHPSGSDGAIARIEAALADLPHLPEGAALLAEFGDTRPEQFKDYPKLHFHYRMKTWLDRERVRKGGE